MTVDGQHPEPETSETTDGALGSPVKVQFDAPYTFLAIMNLRNAQLSGERRCDSSRKAVPSTAGHADVPMHDARGRRCASAAR